MLDNPDAYVSSAIQGNNVMMANQKRVLLLSQDSATGLLNYPCSLTRTPREFAKYSVGYAFEKHSVYVALFSYIINDLVEFGNVHYIHSLIGMERPTSRCMDDKQYSP